MVNVRIDGELLVDVLMDKLDYWNVDPMTKELFEEMYENYVDEGVFDGMDLDINYIVDNDYVNYCRVVEEEEEEFEELMKIYENQGLGDCSCETSICDSIEAFKNNMFLVR